MCDGFHAGLASRRGCETLEEGNLLSLGSGILGGRQVHGSGQDTGGVDAHVRVVDLEKAADHHACSGKQHHGKRHFSGDQDGGEMFRRARLPLVAPRRRPSARVHVELRKTQRRRQPEQIPVPIEIAMRYARTR